MKFALIVAVDKNNGIGKNNTIPWRLPADLKYFSDTTTKTQDPQKINAVIMGRRTWESLPPKSKPLKGRLNIVVSSQTLTLPEGVLLAHSLEEAFAKISDFEKSSSGKKIEKVFVIGGAKIFEQAITHPDCEEIYLTQIEQTFDCDTFFPQIDAEKFQLTQTSEIFHENSLDFKYKIYKRKI